MKIHALIGMVGFGLLIAASYLQWGLAPSLAVAGGGLLLDGLASVRGGRS